MIICEALKYGASELKHAGVDEPSFEAGMLVCDSIQCDRTFLCFNPKCELTQGQQQKFHKMLEERLSRKPLQYITGNQDFMGLPFKVTPSVLIPRPETETLVEEVLKMLELSADALVLDLGTGSGCIAVSISNYKSECRLVASDISKHAIKVAMHNAATLHVSEKIEFMVSDLFKSIPTSYKFDIIVSNPPYIPTSDIDKLQPEISFEPRIALDGSADGLFFYRQIVNEAPKFLTESGILALEVGCGQSNIVLKMVEEHFKYYTVVNDTQSIPRVILCKNV